MPGLFARTPLAYYRFAMLLGAATEPTQIFVQFAFSRCSTSGGRLKQCHTVFDSTTDASQGSGVPLTTRRDIRDCLRFSF